MRFSLELGNSTIVGLVVSTHIFILLGLASFSTERASSFEEAMIANIIDTGTIKSVVKKPVSVPELSITNTETNAEKELHVASSPTASEQPLEMAGKSSTPSGKYPRQQIYNPRPKYPLSSRRLKEEGIVTVKLCIDQTGVVDKLSILRGSGHQSLDESTIHTLAQWKFLPISGYGDRVSNDCFQVPVQFTLQG